MKEIISIGVGNGMEPQEPCVNCGHDKWDHESETLNIDDDIVFLRCEEEGCDCRCYEEE